jgi:hypothetical protein
MVYNIATRFVVRVLPNGIRGWVYQKMAR